MNCHDGKKEGGAKVYYVDFRSKTHTSSTSSMETANESSRSNQIKGKRGKRNDPQKKVHDLLTKPKAELAHKHGARSFSSGMYSAQDVKKLFGLSKAKLRDLEKRQIVAPSSTINGEAYYSFSDLLALKTAKELFNLKLSSKDVETAVAALKKRLPFVTKPLHELRIQSDGKKLFVFSNQTFFEPKTGQLLLDFSTQSVKEEVVRVLKTSSEECLKKTAYDLLVEASQLDEDPAHFDKAIALYLRAIEIEPSLAIAYTNLGNIYFRSGDLLAAETLYHEALKLSPNQAEASYNLGYLMMDQKKYAMAVDYFQRALKSDSSFSDAHFNLGLTYFFLEDFQRAKRHWRKYLELSPDGPWAEQAHEYLSK